MYYIICLRLLGDHALVLSSYKLKLCSHKAAITMFRRRSSDDLPFSRTGGGYSTAVKPTDMRELKIPKVSVAKALGWAWVVLGLMLAWTGTRFCASSREVSALDCDAEACTFTYWDASGSEVHVFPRDSFISAEQIKVRNGQIVDAKIRTRRQKNVKSSYALTFTLEGAEEKVQKPFSKRGIGRQDARSSVQQITRYINRETDEVHRSLDQWGSALGIILIVFGSLFLIARAATGNLEELTKVDKRKRGVKRTSGRSRPSRRY